VKNLLACDYSREALALIVSMFPAAATLRLDLRETLPLGDSSTALLLCRLNSTKDKCPRVAHEAWIGGQRYAITVRGPDGVLSVGQAGGRFDVTAERIRACGIPASLSYGAGIFV
jgi:hypothetical protein